jgi:hypothetical protein
MPANLIVQIDPELNAALHRKCQTLKVPVDEVVERLIRTFLAGSRFIGKDAMPDQDSKIDLKELIKEVKVSGDEPFFGDLTYDQYFALSDSQREALWNQGYRQELEKPSQSQEKEANPDAIPAGQGSNAEIRRRIREHRTQCRSDR